MYTRTNGKAGYLPWNGMDDDEERCIQVDKLKSLSYRNDKFGVKVTLDNVYEKQPLWKYQLQSPVQTVTLFFYHKAKDAALLSPEFLIFTFTITYRLTMHNATQ